MKVNKQSNKHRLRFFSLVCYVRKVGFVKNDLVKGVLNNFSQDNLEDRVREFEVGTRTLVFILHPKSF